MNSFYLLLVGLMISSITSKRHHNTKSENLLSQAVNMIPDPMLCNKTVCPESQGICTFDNICQCYQGYVSIFTQTSTVQCGYKQKKQIIFLLLEFIASFGIGHLYAGRYIFAIAKFGFVSVILSIYFFCGPLNNSETTIRKAAKIRLFLMLAFMSWQVIDAIFIGMKYYTDGNGIELDEWF